MSKNLLTKRLWHRLFFIAVFLFSFFPPLDTDLGWHLRYGNYFWQTGKLLIKNRLTLINFDYRWPHSYTLYQILTSGLYKLTGFFGLSLGTAFVILIFFYLLYLVFNKNISKTVASFVIIVIFSWSVINLGWRAQIFSLLGILLTFQLLKSKKGVSYLPLVFLIWANFHGAFVFGLLIYAIYLLVNLIELKTEKISKKGYIKKAVIFFLSLIATFINPFGLKIWWEGWHHFKVPMNKLIAEWVGPQQLTSFFMVGFFIICLYLFFREKKKTLTNIFLFSCLPPFFYLGLSARRNIPFFFITSCLFIFKTKASNKLSQNINFQSISISIIILICLWGVFVRLPDTIITNSSWKNYCQARSNFPFPCSAVDFIKKNNIQGNFYNTYEWGGFLTWQIDDSLFFVDGRMPAWPTKSNKSPYTIYLEVIQAQPGWEQTLKEYNINYLFISGGTFLDLELKNNPEKYSWHELYRDKQVAIFEKKRKLTNKLLFS